MKAEAMIEALLFWRAEPISFTELGQALSLDEGSLRTALDTLAGSLMDRGLRLLELNGEVSLVTAPEASELIERMTRDELSKDLGKASLETLSVVLYQGPVGKAEIDYIRGVNSHHSLRSLMVRGLIERVSHPHDQRSFLYRATSDLLAHLGITHLEELPEYAQLRSEIATLRTAIPTETA